MKHLLCVAYFFPPSGGAGVQRPLKFVKYLPLSGWTCHVITVRDGVFFANDQSLLQEIPADTDVIRTSSWELERLSVLRSRRRAHSEAMPLAPLPLMSALQKARKWVFPDPQVGWLPHAVRAAQALVKRQQVDAIWTTSSPFTSHLVGLTLQKRLQVPWVADFRDPWSDDPMGLLAHHRVHAFFERRVIEHANAVVGVNHGITDFLRGRDKRARPGKYHVIPNGFDADDFAEPSSAFEAFDDGAWHITMTGSVYAKVDITAFLEALKSLLDAHPQARVRMHWVGQMDRRASAAYKASVQRLGLSRVCTLEGYVAHAESVRWLQRSHLLLLPMFSGQDALHWMPGKIFEYLASRKPVLMLAERGIAPDLLREANAGFVVPPSDVGAITQVLTRLYASHQRGEPVTDPRDVVIAQYERRVLTARLAQVLESL